MSMQMPLMIEKELVPIQKKTAEDFIKKHSELHRPGLEQARHWLGTWVEYVVKDSGISTDISVVCGICKERQWLEDPDYAY